MIFHLNSLKAYQVPNLLQVLPVGITSDTSPSLTGYEAVNLIRNLSDRSCGNNFKPNLDEFGTKGMYESCFKTTES